MEGAPAAWGSGGMGGLRRGGDGTWLGSVSVGGERAAFGFIGA